MANMRTSFKGISKRAKALLQKEESYDVDFKRQIKDLPEDIVAFANSAAGGAILVGVEEYNDDNGQQRGRVIGCSVSDKEKLRIMNSAQDCSPPIKITKEKLRIMNSAQDCSPPIKITVVTENLSSKPFYRIEIPSGQYKPYSTNGGTFKTRADNRKAPLHSQELMAIYIEREGGSFIQRFKEATSEMRLELDRHIQTLFHGILDSTFETVEKINELHVGVEDSVTQAQDEISNYVQEIQDISDHNVERNEGFEKRVEVRLNRLERRIMELLNHFEIKDPVAEDVKKFIRQSVIYHRVAKGEEITDADIEAKYLLFSEHRVDRDIFRECTPLTEFRELYLKDLNELVYSEEDEKVVEWAKAHNK